MTTFNELVPCIESRHSSKTKLLILVEKCVCVCYERSAHPIFYSSSRLARAGEDMLGSTCGAFRSISARNIVAHPKYKAAGYYDVAVIHVKKGFVFNEFLKPICLPTKNASNLDEYKDDLMRLAGEQDLTN